MLKQHKTHAYVSTRKITIFLGNYLKFWILDMTRNAWARINGNKSTHENIILTWFATAFLHRSAHRVQGKIWRNVSCLATATRNSFSRALPQPTWLHLCYWGLKRNKLYHNNKKFKQVVHKHIYSSRPSRVPSQVLYNLCNFVYRINYEERLWTGNSWGERSEDKTKTTRRLLYACVHTSCYAWPQD